jgi:hypothetical protein
MKKPKLPHRTFSLLPDALIPYYKLTINTLMEVIEDKLVKKRIAPEIVEKFYEKIYTTALHLSQETLSSYSELFEETAQKIKTFLRDREKDDDPPERSPDSLKEIYEYLCAFTDPVYGKGALSCSVWYYLVQGGFRGNAYFLFGTPSQFR